MNPVTFEQKMLAWFFLENLSVASLSMLCCILKCFNVQGSSVSKFFHCQFHLCKFFRKKIFAWWYWRERNFHGHLYQLCDNPLLFASTETVDPSNARRCRGLSFHVLVDRCSLMLRLAVSSPVIKKQRWVNLYFWILNLYQIYHLQMSLITS